MFGIGIWGSINCTKLTLFCLNINVDITWINNYYTDLRYLYGAYHALAKSKARLHCINGYWGRPSIAPKKCLCQNLRERIG